MSSLNESLARFGNPFCELSSPLSVSDEDQTVHPDGRTWDEADGQLHAMQYCAPTGSTGLFDSRGQWDAPISPMSYAPIDMPKDLLGVEPQVSPRWSNMTGITNGCEQARLWTDRELMNTQVVPLPEQTSWMGIDSHGVSNCPQRVPLSISSVSWYTEGTRSIQTMSGFRNAHNSYASAKQEHVEQEHFDQEEMQATISVPSQAPRMPMTTVMVRNLPPRLRQEELLQEWPILEYNYNLVYVPYNVKQRCTSRYAFLNFVTEDSAMRFFSMWHGRFFNLASRPNNKPDTKPVEVRISQRQGLDANVRFWKSTLRKNCSSRLLPAVFVGGLRQDFWAFANSMPDQPYTAPARLDVISL